MKTQFLRSWFTVSAIVFIGLIAWIVGNTIHIVSDDPEQATRKVFQRYNPSMDISGIAITPIGYFRSIPAGVGIVFQVKEAGKPLAKIRVTSFLGMGWQETDFLRIENTEQAGCTEPRDRVAVPRGSLLARGR